MSYIENKYRLTQAQKARRLVGAAAFVMLGIAGCGEASAGGPGPASGLPTPFPQPTATHTETPTITPPATETPTAMATVTAKAQPTPFQGGAQVTDIALKPGECVNLSPSDPAAFVVTGDVTVGTDVNHLQRGFDDIAETGMELTVEGSQNATVCAQFGADVHVIQGANKDLIHQEQQEAIQDLRRSGCSNGCSQGVQTFTFQNGVLTFNGMS